jgi:cation:H+ antiporter
MFAFLIVFLIILLFFQKKTILDHVDEPISETFSNSKIFLYLIIGAIFLWLGSEVLIKGAINLATDWGVGERIISISVVSIGTSVPELSTSLIAIYNKEKAISIGNLIGSNIFNILAVMGITSLIHPIEVMDLNLIHKDFLWMLFISFLILPLVFLPIKMRLGAIEGFILIGFYIFFLFQMFF